MRVDKHYLNCLGLALLLSLAPMRVEAQTQSYDACLHLLSLKEESIKAKIVPLEKGTKIMVKEDVVNDLPLIQINSPHENEVSYWVTDRGIQTLTAERFYPAYMFSTDDLAGKKVLDLGCGAGALVRDLIQKNIDAKGLDIYLDATQLQQDYYIRADARNTGEPKNSYDVIFQTYSVFSYEMAGFAKNDIQKVTAVFKEIHRILKPGGVLRLAPLLNVTFEDSRAGVIVKSIVKSQAFITEIAGFKIKQKPNLSWYLQMPRYPETLFPKDWIELEKMD